jgi:hypothetical protein
LEKLVHLVQTPTAKNVLKMSASNAMKDGLTLKVLVLLKRLSSNQASILPLDSALPVHPLTVLNIWITSVLSAQMNGVFKETFSSKTTRATRTPLVVTTK